MATALARPRAPMTSRSKRATAGYSANSSKIPASTPNAISANAAGSERSARSSGKPRVPSGHQPEGECQNQCRYSRDFGRTASPSSDSASWRNSTLAERITTVTMAAVSTCAPIPGIQGRSRVSRAARSEQIDERTRNQRPGQSTADPAAGSRSGARSRPPRLQRRVSSALGRLTELNGEPSHGQRDRGDAQRRARAK